MKWTILGSHHKTWVPLLLVFIGLAVIAPFLDVYFLYILTILCLNVILATGLNLLTGYTGQISLCHSAFLGIGAYSCTILMIRLHLPYPLALLAGGLIAGCAGFLVGIPALRLRGLYLAMVTLGFGEIVHLVFHHWQGLTGGPLGLKVPTARIGPVVFKSELSLFYLYLFVAFIFVILARNLIQSKIGRAFRSIAYSEIAAQASGIDLARYKTLSFALSAFYAGIAGGLYCQLLKYLSPDPFGLFESIQYLTMIVLGGMGSIIGSVLGASLLSILPEILRDFKDYQELIFSLLLMLFILFMPRGIYGMVRSVFRF
jgi:branched-chain amino acid transport system permease protein